MSALVKPGHCGHNRPGQTCGICFPVEPKVERTPDAPTHESTETHPAYGVVGISRWQGSGHRLFGSDFVHRVGLTLTIRKAQRHRSLSNDWVHGREELISITMSEAQWATLVSAVGQGEGVPCTLEYVNGKRVSVIPEPKETRVKQFGDEMKRRFDLIKAEVGALRQRIIEGKGGKESLRLLDTIERGTVANTEFTAEQFDRHMENTVEKAKSEIAGHALRLGIVEGRGPLMFEPKRDDVKAILAARENECPICHEPMHDNDCR